MAEVKRDETIVQSGEGAAKSSGHSNTRHSVHRENKDELVKRLNRIEGQVRGISKMIQDDKYCVDVLNQIAAARAALDQVGLIILEGHVRGCVVQGIKEANEDAIVTELLEVIRRFI